MRSHEDAGLAGDDIGVADMMKVVLQAGAAHAVNLSANQEDVILQTASAKLEEWSLR